MIDRETYGSYDGSEMSDFVRLDDMRWDEVLKAEQAMKSRCAPERLGRSVCAEASSSSRTCRRRLSRVLRRSVVGLYEAG